MTPPTPDHINWHVVIPGIIHQQFPLSLEYERSVRDAALRIQRMLEIDKTPQMVQIVHQIHSAACATLQAHAGATREVLERLVKEAIGSIEAQYLVQAT